MSIDAKEVGRQIRKTRESKHLSVDHLAQMVQMTGNEIVGLENGTIHDVGFEHLDALARALEVRMIELIKEPQRSQGAEEVAAEEARERESFWSGLPPLLRTLIDQELKRGHPVPEDVVRSLASINFQDKQPSGVEEWRTVLNALLRTLTPT
jgi:transcriptional regulator with XRE-family HTH domain